MRFRTDCGTRLPDNKTSAPSAGKKQQPRNYQRNPALSGKGDPRAGMVNLHNPHHRNFPKPIPPARGVPPPLPPPFFITHRNPTPAMNLIRPAIITGLILTFLVSLAAYPVLPDQVVPHWNAAGEPDGSMGKLADIGLVPLNTVALARTLEIG